MTYNKNIIIVALDITRQLYTWDSKLHKDVFTRHLKHYIEQSKLSTDEKKAALFLMENLLHAINDNEAYDDGDDAENDTSNILDRIYDVKTMQNFPKQRRRSGSTAYEQNQEVFEEIMQLKLRLHEEIISVKNDIKICKKYISDQVDKKDDKKSAWEMHIERIESAREKSGESRGRSEKKADKPTGSKQPAKRDTSQTKALASSNVKSNIVRSFSQQSLTLRPNASSDVKRRGSSTNLYDELHDSKDNENEVVTILLGDLPFQQISQKRFLQNNNMISICDENFTVESGFNKLIDYIIDNPNGEIEAVCIQLGSRNLEERSCQPNDLALSMVGYVKELHRRINGKIYVYGLPPRIKDSALDRKTTHFNNQLAASIFKWKLPRVTMMDNVIPKDFKCFQIDGQHLSGPGVNKLIRAVRKNINESDK